jgi:hypothetical protein
MIYFESVIIIGLILLEFFLAYETYMQINNYKNIFKDLPIIKRLFVKTELGPSGNSYIIINDKETGNNVIKTEPVSSVFSSSKNVIQVKILTTINDYLQNNRGAAIDYHIIKEIVNRNIESEEEAIESKIPSPLYIGLSATMIGIIVGLWSIDFKLAQINAIEPLINGVKIAMAASVIGLGLTTWLSIKVYKVAKSQLDAGRNDFISLIQTDLLPSIMGPGQSGMSSLASKLDEFGRTTSQAVSEMNSVVKNSNSQVVASQTILNQIQHLDLRNIVGANLKIFKSLEGMMESFQAFPEYYKELNKSLGKTTQLSNSLTDLLQRSDNLNVVLIDLKETVSESRLAAEFFNQHIEEFSQYGTAVNKAVEETNYKMAQAIGQLEQSATSLFSHFQKKMEGYDEQLSKSFEKSIEKFNEVAQVQIELITDAFSNSRPQFEHLQNLVTIKTEIEKFNSHFGAEMLKQQISTGDKIDSLTKELKNMLSLQSHASSGSQGSEIPSLPLIKKDWLDTVFKIVLIIMGLTVISFMLHGFYLYWRS